MTLLYATLIKKGLRSFSSIPDHLKTEVRRILNDEGLDENGNIIKEE